MLKARFLLAVALCCASGASALPFRIGATLDYTVVRDSGRAITATSLRMLDSLHTDSGTVWSVAIRDSVHATGRVRQDTAVVRRVQARDGSDSLVVWDRPSCLAAWEPEPYRPATSSTRGSGDRWWSIATACYERGYPLARRMVAHDSLTLRPDSSILQGRGASGVYSFEPRGRIFRTFESSLRVDAPAGQWLPGPGWSGVLDDIYGEMWTLEMIDGLVVPAAERWGARGWSNVEPQAGMTWTWELVWSRSYDCAQGFNCSAMIPSFTAQHSTGQSLARLRVHETLPDSSGWKGWRLKYVQFPVADSASLGGRDTVDLVLRQSVHAPWQIQRDVVKLDPDRTIHGLVSPVLKVLLEGFLRKPTDSAFRGSGWVRRDVQPQPVCMNQVQRNCAIESQGLILPSRGVDTVKFVDLQYFSPFVSQSIESFRLLSVDGQEFRTLPATRFQRPVASSSLSRLTTGQVRSWLAQSPEIISLRAISVAGRAVALDPRAPESGLSRLHGLYTLEARTGAGVRRAVLLGL